MGVAEGGLNCKYIALRLPEPSADTILDSARRPSSHCFNSTMIALSLDSWFFPVSIQSIQSTHFDVSGSWLTAVELHDGIGLSLISETL